MCIPKLESCTTGREWVKITILLHQFLYSQWCCQHSFVHYRLCSSYCIQPKTLVLFQKIETAFIKRLKGMKYISTRTTKREYTFTEAFLESFAEDGGLLCPKEIPRISTDTLEKWSVGICCIVKNSIWISLIFIWRFFRYLLTKVIYHPTTWKSFWNLYSKSFINANLSLYWMICGLSVDQASRSHFLGRILLWTHLSYQGFFHAVHWSFSEVSR